MDQPARIDGLGLPADDMRDIGYRVVDAIVEQFETVREQPAIARRSRAAMEELLREDVPETPGDFEAILSRMQRDVFAHAAPLDHPRFFGFVPSPINFISVMAEALAAAHNPFLGSWLVSPGPTTIELVTLDWLRELCGMPAVGSGGGAGGLFTSGGSMANLGGLAAARAIKLDDDMTGAVAYGSDQTHSSVDRAMRVLGFKPEQWRPIESDSRFKIDLAKLREAIRTDRLAGRRPFCVVVNAGTTNTGAIDPLPGVADLCAAEDLWLHIDGAYGAPAVLTDEGRAQLAGLERADSLSLDPHKWLFQPYEIGCLLVRDPVHLLQANHIFKDYMRDAVGTDEEVNLRDYGVQLTRNFRALKLWLSLQVFGLDAFRSAVDHGLRLARFAEQLLTSENGTDRWEVVSPATLGIICFRYRPNDVGDETAIDDLNLRLVDAMYDSGYAMVSSTSLRGRPVLRLCPINPRTTEADIRGTIERFEQLAARLSTRPVDGGS